MPSALPCIPNSSVEGQGWGGSDEISLFLLDHFWWVVRLSASPSFAELHCRTALRVRGAQHCDLTCIRHDTIATVGLRWHLSSHASPVLGVTSVGADCGGPVKQSFLCVMQCADASTLRERVAHGVTVRVFAAQGWAPAGAGAGGSWVFSSPKKSTGNSLPETFSCYRINKKSDLFNNQYFIICYFLIIIKYFVYKGHLFQILVDKTEENYAFLWYLISQFSYTIQWFKKWKS